MYLLKVCAAHHPEVGRRFDRDEALRLIDEAAAGAGIEPELVLHVISCEATLLGHPVTAAVANAVMAHWPEAVHQVVSLGCLGLYAAVRQVRAQQPRAALVFVYEVPGDLVQHRLDGLGLGVGADPRGMVAEEGIACIPLQREDVATAGPGDLRLLECEIVAKRPTISGTRQMLQDLDQRLRPLLPTLDHWIMFDVRAHWSNFLVRWFNARFCDELARVNVLPSSEPGREHRLSYKPALELATHRGQVEPQQRLGVSSVGVGGRFGWMVFSATALAPSAPAAVPTGEGRRGRAARWQPRGSATGHETLGATAGDGLLCAEPRHMGQRNAYFVWPLAPRRRGEPVAGHHPAIVLPGRFVAS